jgi:actin related protein 2/3 complex subunit 3
MPAYNSAITAEMCKMIGNIPILPLKISSKAGGRGPAPFAKEDSYDIIDEALDLFKSNILFTNFEIKAQWSTSLSFL